MCRQGKLLLTEEAHECACNARKIGSPECEKEFLDIRIL
jgi:hypothetical protein